MPIGLDTDQMHLPVGYFTGQLWVRHSDGVETGKIRISSWKKWRDFMAKLHGKTPGLISFPSNWPSLLPYEDISSGEEAAIGPNGMPQYWMQPASLAIQGWTETPDVPPIPQFDTRPSVLARTWPKEEE